MTQLNVLKKYMIINIYIYMVLLFHHLDPTVQPINRTPCAQPIDPCTCPPRPRHPSDPAPPIRPRSARPILQLLTPRIPTPCRPTSHPCLLRPMPLPLVSTASCYASRYPTTDERPCLPLSSSLPRSAPASSYTQRLSHRRSCLLRPSASQND
jgi:hypothetical protein